MSKVVYIMGCGRSGTTLLGVILGNSRGALNVGELVDYPKFSGIPSGFDAESDNFKFWEKVSRSQPVLRSDDDYK